MRAVLQRVQHAHVTVDGQEVGSCRFGYLILLGVGPHDTQREIEWLWKKITHLRIFEDESGKVNKSLLDINGEVLIVSQFTLYADCKKGNRPTFSGAGSPEMARALYEEFCNYAERDGLHVGRGIFAAMMEVSLVNDGPFTIVLDTERDMPHKA